MIASFDDLLLQVTRLMDGDNVSASELETATLLQVVSMAERRIYRELRSRLNQKAWTQTVTSNAITLPTDFEACAVVHFGGEPLQPVAEEWLRSYLDHNPTGDCRYFAEAGNALFFGPSVANGTAVQGRYFYRLPDLSSATFSANTLIAREPDLFLYACLTEGVSFFGKDPQYWEAKYQAVRDRINTDSVMTAASAGRIIVRPSARLIG